MPPSKSVVAHCPTCPAWPWPAKACRLAASSMTPITTSKLSETSQIIIRVLEWPQFWWYCCIPFKKRSFQSKFAVLTGREGGAGGRCCLAARGAHDRGREPLLEDAERRPACQRARFQAALEQSQGAWRGAGRDWGGQGGPGPGQRSRAGDAQHGLRGVGAEGGDHRAAAALPARHNLRVRPVRRLLPNGAARLRESAKRRCGTTSSAAQAACRTQTHVGAAGLGGRARQREARGLGRALARVRHAPGGHRRRPRPEPRGTVDGHGVAQGGVSRTRRYREGDAAAGGERLCGRLGAGAVGGGEPEQQEAGGGRGRHR